MKPVSRHCLILGTAAVVVALATLAPAAAPKDAPGAKALLAAALRDPNTTDVALAALRLTGDPDLVGLYAAYCGHPDRRVRLVCVAALGDLKGEEAVAALLERAKSDSMSALRAQAIAILIEKKAATAPQLQEAMKGEDENVQYLATRGLIALGQGALAADKLAQLAQSKDPSTAGLSRLDLLALGKADQLEPVTRILSDPNTPPLAVGMMLERIYEDKIAAAAPIAEKVSLSAAGEDVRLHAFRAVSAVSADAPARLLDALGKAAQPQERVLLFRMLAAQKGAATYLRTLADGNDLTGALARFELSRPARDAASGKAAAEAMAFAHPIVLEHVLSCLREDLSQAPEKMDAYAPALLAVLRKTPKPEGRLRSEQEVCARCATLLGDIGGPAALEGLKEVLAGPFGESKRAAVGGLVRTKNPAAAALLKPLLDSPYPELSATSAIALARHGEKDASPILQDIVAHASRYSPDLLAMVSWYALKLSGQHTAAVQELVQSAK